MSRRMAAKGTDLFALPVKAQVQAQTVEWLTDRIRLRATSHDCVSRVVLLYCCYAFGLPTDGLQVVLRAARV